MIGDITFQQNSTGSLTIEPGCEIYLNDYDFNNSSGWGGDKVWLYFAGGSIFNCVGSEQDSIWFIPYKKNELYTWEGIKFDYRTYPVLSTISFTNISGAERGISHGGGGYWDIVDTLVIKNSNISNCEIGFNYNDSSTVYIENSVIKNCVFGISFSRGNNKLKVFIKNNEIINCVDGLRIELNNPISGIVINNNFINCFNWAIITGESSNMIIKYNNFVGPYGSVANSGSKEGELRYNIWFTSGTAQMISEDNPQNISTLYNNYDK